MASWVLPGTIDGRIQGVDDRKGSEEFAKDQEAWMAGHLSRSTPRDPFPPCHRTTTVDATKHLPAEILFLSLYRIFLIDNDQSQLTLSMHANLLFLQNIRLKMDLFMYTRPRFA